MAPAVQQAPTTDYLLSPFTAHAIAVIQPAIDAAVDRLQSMLNDR